MTDSPRVSVTVHHLPPRTSKDDDPIFAAARTKVDRAKTFIQELHRVLLEHVASDPLQMTPTPPGVHPAGAVLSWRPTLLPGAIVGDCVHNLRSSLDLMASELARRNGKTDKSVSFPFADTKEELPRQIRDKNFKKCGADAVSLLRKLEPFTGGNVRLRALHDLDRRDKHSALIPHYSIGHVKGRAYTDTEGVVRLHVEMGPGGMQFFFPEGTPLEKLPLVETLNELVEMIEGILDSFAALVDERAP